MKLSYGNPDASPLAITKLRKGVRKMKRCQCAPLIAVAALLFAACGEKSSVPSASQPAASVSQVPGCLSSAGLYKSTASLADFTYEFTVSKLSLNFVLPDKCTADSIRFATSYKFEGDTIFVTSIDTATINARCPCNYLIHAEFEGLPLDRYYVVCTRIDDGVETVPYSRYVFRDDARGTNEEIVYSNGFESGADTAKWIGYGSMQLSNDVPPGGGNRSLFVSGGCTVPHAAFRIGEVSQDSRFILRFWGKRLFGSGGVGLGFSQSPTSGIGVNVVDSTWTHYESQDVFYCPADSTLWLNVNAGGFVAGAILVDDIQVVKVK